MNTAPITLDFTSEDYLDLIILTTHQSRNPETNPELAANLTQQDGFILMQLHGMLATLLPSAGTARSLLTIWADHVANLHAEKTTSVQAYAHCESEVATREHFTILDQAMPT